MRELDEIRLRVREVLEEKEKVIVDLTLKMHVRVTIRDISLFST